MASGFLIALVVLLLFDWQLKKHHDRQVRWKLQSHFIDNLLEAAARSISRVTGVEHVRASLMVSNGDNLRITNSYGFGEQDQDSSIEIPIGAGSAGRAWVQGRVVIADLHQRPLQGGADWALPPKENLKVRPTLNSVISVPLMGGNPYRVVGVLNVDSDHRMAETRFFEDEIQYLIYSFSKALSPILDDLMG
jgi:putative methionine-R-sulfoxide reductase with GAF domain